MTKLRRLWADTGFGDAIAVGGWLALTFASAVVAVEMRHPFPTAIACAGVVILVAYAAYRWRCG